MWARILIFVILVVARTSDIGPSNLLAAGDEALAVGDMEAAITQYNLGISALQDESTSLSVEISLHVNLGTALAESEAVDDAIESYSSAIKACQDNIDDIADKYMKAEAQEIAAQAAFFRGMTLQDQGRARDAVDSYELALQLDPRHWASAANAGSLLHDVFSDYRGAVQKYNMAYALLTDESQDVTDPPQEPSFILSELQYRIGLCISHSPDQKCALMDDPSTVVDCSELARQAFATAVDYNADNEAARHMLATYTADATMKRASNTYIKELFDNYAQNFEHSLLDDLRYDGFQRLRRAHDRAFDGMPPYYQRVLDGGCGTGLAGEQFRNISHFMIGVDLSQAIIDEANARRPHLYDASVAGDLVEQLVAHRPLSLVIAADSLIYFGDIMPVLEAMQKGLEPGGYAAFTLENASLESEASLCERKPDWRWQLTPSGRFAHRKEYIVESAESVGLSLVHYEPLDGFRFEGGTAVRGHAFILRSGTNRDEL